MINDLHGDLADTSLETATENLRRHVLSGNRFAPSIAELIRPLDPEKTEQDIFHENMRQSAQEYFSMVDHWSKTASSPPDEIRRIMKLPPGEREEALKAYAKRKTAERA